MVYNGSIDEKSPFVYTPVFGGLTKPYGMCTSLLN